MSNLQLESLKNEVKKHGRAARVDEMTLNNGMLTFNETTRKNLKIPAVGYCEMFVDKSDPEGGNLYLKVHADGGENRVRIKKNTTAYFHMQMPTAALQHKVFSSKEKIRFKGMRISLGKKRSAIMLSIITK